MIARSPARHSTYSTTTELGDIAKSGRREVRGRVRFHGQQRSGLYARDGGSLEGYAWRFSFRQRRVGYGLAGAARRSTGAVDGGVVSGCGSACGDDRLVRGPGRAALSLVTTVAAATAADWSGVTYRFAPSADAFTLLSGQARRPSQIPRRQVRRRRSSACGQPRRAHNVAPPPIFGMTGPLFRQKFPGIHPQPTGGSSRRSAGYQGLQGRRVRRYLEVSSLPDQK